MAKRDKYEDMGENEYAIRKYADESQQKFIKLLTEIMNGSPALFAPFAPLAKENALGYISDLCADLFGLIAEEATVKDLKIETAEYLAHVKSESTHAERA